MLIQLITQQPLVLPPITAWSPQSRIIKYWPTMRLLVLAFNDPWVKSREQWKVQPRCLSGRCMSLLPKSKSDFMKKSHNFCHHFLVQFFHMVGCMIQPWLYVENMCVQKVLSTTTWLFQMLLIIFVSNLQKCITFHCQHSPLSWVLSFICLIWCNLLFWSVMQSSHFPYCSHFHSKKQDFLLWGGIFRYRASTPWHN